MSVISQSVAEHCCLLYFSYDQGDETEGLERAKITDGGCENKRDHSLLKPIPKTARITVPPVVVSNWDFSRIFPGFFLYIINFAGRIVEAGWGRAAPRFAC